MRNVTRIGIDLAKHVFQLHGVDERGHTVLRRRLARSQVRAVLTQLPPCVVGLEACGSAHYWARALRALGHDVRLMALQFVRPYRKNDKNDGNDAEAICEAVGRPQRRFVPVKEVGQQAVLTVHRARQLLIAEWTALVNHSRGLLAEFGLIVPAGIGALRRLWPSLLETPDLPTLAREVFTDLAVAGRGRADHGLRSPRGPAGSPDGTGAATDADARRRARDGDGGGGHGGQRSRLHKRPPVCRVAGAGAPATFQWGHSAPGADHQTRGCLPPHLAHSWRACGDAAARATPRCHQPLGHGAPRPTGLQQSRGRAGRQARAHRVGAAGHGTDLSAHRGVSLSEPG